MERARRRKLVEDLAAKIRRERKDVEAVILFGSAARGTDLPDSDVDLVVVTHRGAWKGQYFVLDGVLFTVYWTGWRALRRDMLEPRADATSHGFLEGKAIYDPKGRLESLRAEVAALPASFYRESAVKALYEMYEYVCKVRNARRRKDRANLRIAARTVAHEAAVVVALVNRRHYPTENAMARQWAEFPDLPRDFGKHFRTIVEGPGSPGEMYEATMALWRLTRDWASRRGVRLHTVRALSAVRIPKASPKTT